MKKVQVSTVSVDIVVMLMNEWINDFSVVQNTLNSHLAKSEDIRLNYFYFRYDGQP